MPPLITTGIRGMRDSLDPTTARPNKAFSLINVYPEDPEIGGAIVGRPGFDQLGAQLGGGNKGQRCYQYTKLNGTEYTIAFVNGLMYKFNWGTDTWTQVTLVGVSLTAGVRIFCTTFADYLVVNPNDGTNKPWIWDGTTFTSLTNCQLAYGRIAVYYAKLFFILWSDRATFIWSEEGDPTIGYEAGSYANAWTLRQTDQEPLYAMYGTNDLLFYFRERSIGAISGAVEENFEATGTREGVSETIGCASAASITSYENEVFFIDADGRPRSMTPGGFVNDEMWQDLRETIKSQAAGKLSTSIALYWPPANLILIGVVESGTVCDAIYAINARTRDIAGVWRGFDFESIDVVKNANGVPTMVILSSDGYAYQFGNPGGSIWDDGFNSGDVAISHTVIGPPLGIDVKREKIFDRMDLNLRAKTAMTSMSINYITPRGTSSAQTVTRTVATDATTPAIEQHTSVGLSGRGRWIMPKVVHSQAAEQFGLLSIEIESFDDAEDPAIP